MSPWIGGLIDYISRMKQFNLTLYLSSLVLPLLLSCSKPIDCSVEDCKGEYYNGLGKFAPKCDEIDAILFQSHYEDGTGWVKEIIESSEVNVMYYNYKPYTGKVKKCFGNGRINSIITFKNGIHDGVAMWYHENGLLRSKMIYKNDLLVGERFDYYGNGMIEEKGIYWNDMVYSKWYSYTEDGHLIKVSIHKGEKGNIGEQIDCWGECE